MPPRMTPTHALAGERYNALVELADAHAEAERFAPAEKCYRSAVAICPGHAEAHIGLGMLLLQTDRLEEARAVFSSLARRRPDCAEAFTGLAAIAFRQEHWPMAFELYLKALELDTESLLALLGLFQTSCRMGTFGKIIDYLELYLDSHPDDQAVLFCLATLYVRERRWADARDVLEPVVERQPAHRDAREMLHLACRELDDNRTEDPQDFHLDSTPEHRILPFNPAAGPATVLACRLQ